MFPLFTYRQNRAQDIEPKSSMLWEQCLEQQPEGECTINRDVFENERFWKDYTKLVKQAQQNQTVRQVVFATYTSAQNAPPLYSFSEFGRLYAIGNGTLFSFGFLFIFSAVLSKNLLLESFLYLLLLPLSITIGIFLARSFKTCLITSNALIVRNPWMFVNKRFDLHQIKDVTIDDNPHGYWYLQVRTPKRVYKYNVNINYCKLRKLLDLLNDHHITTYDNISLSA
ncbi:hypothetical protein [Microscilla marina]|uniref:Uncharacterized protein n=1 Tax=Microscilla marina ATCC 23134 TaxID=313606 RepID=A1ZCE9_MICM2|nr:hypothetical protein [Microscilla marina]EAY31951.1 hypothetical protein M23134_01980 [Microscilla marina ATCC 23134]